jgi:Right handed beta helix region
MRLFIALLATCSMAFAGDYYVATSGSDQNPGTLQRPWATTQIFWKTCFQPGDRISFQGGATFKGRIYFNVSCSVEGSPVAPIVLTSYGAGRAIVEGGFEAHDKGGIELRSLNFRNLTAGNTEDGIAFYGTDHTNTTRSYLRIDKVEISNFGAFGVAIGPWWEDTGGYSDVRITNTVSNSNRKGGIVMYATATGKLYANKNVYVGDSEAFNSTGYRMMNFPVGWKLEGTGNGILLGSVDGATIERCKAYNNGANNDYTDGPVGIMVYDSRNVLIQNNESHSNKTLINDGNGFALDRNTSNSVLQNNWSHDNYGVGMYVAQNVDQPYNFGNKVRYNLSERDGRRGRYAGISLWGAMRDIEVNHNKVVMPASTTGSPVGMAMSNASVAGSYMQNIYVHDNVFQVSGGVTLVYLDPALAVGSSGFKFKSNWYYSDFWRLVWGNSAYSSLSAFVSATGQN